MFAISQTKNITSTSCSCDCKLWYSSRIASHFTQQFGEILKANTATANTILDYGQSKVQVHQLRMGRE